MTTVTYFILHENHSLQVDLLKCHVMRGTGALVINALLDFFSYALCVPYSETTDSAHFDMLLEMLAGQCFMKEQDITRNCVYQWVTDYYLGIS